MNFNWSKASRAKALAWASIVKAVRKTNVPISVKPSRCDNANKGTPSSSALRAAARASLETRGPMIPITWFSKTKVSIAAAAMLGSPCVSLTISSMPEFVPKANSIACKARSPYWRYLPLKGKITPRAFGFTSKRARKTSKNLAACAA